MAERLRQFERDEVGLKRLIDDLEGLLNALEITSDEWKEEFRSEWLDLEVAYAVVDDRTETVPTVTDPGVADAVRALSEMVAERLRR